MTNQNNNYIKSLLSQNPLLVFALEDEAKKQFSDFNTVFVGVGKINATYNLTKAISTTKPSIIVNLGSAGSSIFSHGQVICCTRFIQRDMDVTALGLPKFKTPFSNTEVILKNGLHASSFLEGICGTGDNFDISGNHKDYNVIDMEAYALSWICKKNDIPFLCLKYISDGANEKAQHDWNTQVHSSAEGLKAALDLLKG